MAIYNNVTTGWALILHTLQPTCEFGGVAIDDKWFSVSNNIADENQPIRAYVTVNGDTAIIKTGVGQTGMFWVEGCH